MSTPAPPTRRDELLELAATMFAERGLRATTVRDIADSAGILSGSLYHHFSSKEEMVDELLRGFLDWLFDRYQEIVATEPNPLERLKGLFMASFEAIADRHAQVVIYQDEAKRLSSQERFSYVEERNKEQPGHRGGLLAARHRCRPGVPLHPRHHMGFGPLVSAGWTANGRAGRPAVPRNRSRRYH
jgi:AcrR family transcriptional regulator